MIVLAERALARRAGVASLDVAERLEVAGSDFPVVGASRVVAPLLSEFHDAHLPREMIRRVVVHGVRIHSVNFTAYGYSTVNGPLNQRLGAPVRDILVYRYIFGVEKTFDDGNGSIGVRLPLDQLTSTPTVPARFKQFGGTSTALDDMDIYAKYILKQDPRTGSLISVGLAVTPTTGGGSFAGAKYIQYINTTLFQPFVGYIWTRRNFYLQGFSAFEFPVNPSQVTEMYNDVGMGYFLFRANDPGRFLTAVAPTFEVHVSSPLNHRGFDNPSEVGGTPAVVNLTYGLNLEFSRNALLTFGFVTPVTGPRPFDYEALVLFNYRFGWSARRAIPPVTSG